MNKTKILILQLCLTAFEQSKAMGHFRDALNLIMKARQSAQPHFHNEVQSNSEMAHHVRCCRKESKIN